MRSQGLIFKASVAEVSLKKATSTPDNESCDRGSWELSSYPDSPKRSRTSPLLFP
ncbi:MAG: hypothetical protein SW833_03140 [Cyanobacteriota bacterium]|nr:hypothetical protein [Cyanobacteriota bacterium]